MIRLIPLLVSAVLLTGCRTGPQLSDLSPELGQGHAQIAASAPVNTSVPLRVSAPVSVTWTLNVTSQLDTCVLPGTVILTPDTLDLCLKQTALPDGVTVTSGAAARTDDTMTLTRNTTRTFTHDSALTFTVAGTFTVFPRQQVRVDGVNAGVRVSPGTRITVQ